MANEWKVIEDLPKHGKRWVKIRDLVNKRDYSSFFSLTESNAAIIAKFRKSVKEHRQEIADRAAGQINLTNFEASL